MMREVSLKEWMARRVMSLFCSKTTKSPGAPLTRESLRVKAKRDVVMRRSSQRIEGSVYMEGGE